MGLMTGKRGLIMGLANDKSIAWGIAETLRAEGAEIGVTYMGDAMKKRVLPLAEQLNATIVAECDAGDPESIATLMTQAKDTWGQIDFIVHAIGFSDKSELRGQYINTSRGNFLMTIEWKEKLSKLILMQNIWILGFGSNLELIQMERIIQKQIEN